MAARNRMQSTPFRRMRLVEVSDQQANEKLIRNDDPIVSSMARVLPLIQNPKRTKNTAADLAVSVANMQHYKALERQRKAEEVQVHPAMENELVMDMEMGALNAVSKPKPKPKCIRAKRSVQNKGKHHVLFSPRRTRKQEPSVWKVYQ